MKSLPELLCRIATSSGSRIPTWTFPKTFAAMARSLTGRCWIGFLLLPHLAPPKGSSRSSVYLYGCPPHVAQPAHPVQCVNAVHAVHAAQTHCTAQAGARRSFCRQHMRTRRVRARAAGASAHAVHPYTIKLHSTLCPTDVQQKPREWFALRKKGF